MDEQADLDLHWPFMYAIKMGHCYGCWVIGLDQELLQLEGIDILIFLDKHKLFLI